MGRINPYLWKTKNVPNHQPAKRSISRYFNGQNGRMNIDFSPCNLGLLEVSNAAIGPAVDTPKIHPQ